MAGILNILLLRELINRRSLRTKPIFRNREDAFSLPDDVFVEYFRLTKHLVDEVCEELSPILESESTRGNVITVQTKVLCALRFYATGSHQQSVANEFCLQISQPSASRAVRLVSQAMCKKLLKKWVNFPSITSQLHEEKYNFMVMSGFPGVIGAIDCTHIEIHAPPRNSIEYPEQEFANKHGTHSLNVQMVCDSNQRIMSCNARFPGSSKDSYVWHNSALKEKIKKISQEDGNCWLVGDSDYPLEPWLMVPINDEVGEPENRYNASHKKARNPIQKCISVLKSRFRCLRGERVLHYSPPNAAYIMYSCVILHNICKHHNIPDVEEYISNRSYFTGTFMSDLNIPGVQIEENVSDSSDFSDTNESDIDIHLAGAEVQRQIVLNYFTENLK